MFLKLRILFTILAVICVALVLPIGAFFDLTWAIVVALAGVAFYLLMLLMKQEQEKREPPKMEKETEKSPPEDTNS